MLVFSIHSILLVRTFLFSCSVSIPFINNFYICFIFAVSLFVWRSRSVSSTLARTQTKYLFRFLLKMRAMLGRSPPFDVIQNTCTPHTHTHGSRYLINYLHIELKIACTFLCVCAQNNDYHGMKPTRNKTETMKKSSSRSKCKQNRAATKWNGQPCTVANGRRIE